MPPNSIILLPYFGIKLFEANYISKIQKQSPGGVLQKGVLRNFAKFTGKNLCQSLFLIKEAGRQAGRRPVTLLKMRL